MLPKSNFSDTWEQGPVLQAGFSKDSSPTCNVNFFFFFCIPIYLDPKKWLIVKKKKRFALKVNKIYPPVEASIPRGGNSRENSDVDKREKRSNDIIWIYTPKKLEEQICVFPIKTPIAPSYLVFHNQNDFLRCNTVLQFIDGSHLPPISQPLSVRMKPPRWWSGWWSDCSVCHGFSVVLLIFQAA